MEIFQKLTGALFLSLSLPLHAYAGEFSLVTHSTGAVSISFSGPISDGDAGKFVSLIDKFPAEIVRATSIQLDSSGGSISEALSLAKEIERSGLIVTVEDGDTCASACFLLLASAQYRWIGDSSSVHLHRPYLSTPSTSLDGYSSDSSLQQQTTLEMRRYLEQRSIASQLIDKMMRNPSNEAYRMTVHDMRMHMGNLAPTLEELTISKCGLTNSNIFTEDRDFRGIDMPCIRFFLIPMKAQYVRSLVGQARYSEALERL